VVLHTRQTLVGALVDTQPVPELELIEVLPASWVESQGNPTAVPLERIAVVTGVGTGEELQDKDYGEVVDNIEAQKAVEAS